MKYPQYLCKMNEIQMTLFIVNHNNICMKSKRKYAKILLHVRLHCILNFINIASNTFNAKLTAPVEA